MMRLALVFIDEPPDGGRAPHWPIRFGVVLD